jgi:hypothetical protein
VGPAYCKRRTDSVRLRLRSAAHQFEDVRDSTVPLFLAQGTGDDTTLCADLFTFEAIRQQPKRPLRYVVVDQANHAFETSGGRWRIAEVFDDFLTWALDSNRETGLTVLK